MLGGESAREVRIEGSTEEAGLSAGPSHSQKAAGLNPHPVLRWDTRTESLDVQALLAKVWPTRLPSSGCLSGQRAPPSFRSSTPTLVG